MRYTNRRKTIIKAIIIVLAVAAIMFVFTGFSGNREVKAETNNEFLEIDKSLIKKIHDDPKLIKTIIPEVAFREIGTYKFMGANYGYYVTTDRDDFSHSFINYGIATHVILFKIEAVYEKDRLTLRVESVFGGTFHTNIDNGKIYDGIDIFGTQYALTNIRFTPQIVSYTGTEFYDKNSSLRITDYDSAFFVHGNYYLNGVSRNANALDTIDNCLSLISFCFPPVTSVLYSVGSSINSIVNLADGKSKKINFDNSALEMDHTNNFISQISEGGPFKIASVGLNKNSEQVFFDSKNDRYDNKNNNGYAEAKFILNPGNKRFRIINNIQFDIAGINKSNANSNYRIVDSMEFEKKMDGVIGQNSSKESENYFFKEDGKIKNNQKGDYNIIFDYRGEDFVDFFPKTDGYFSIKNEMPDDEKIIVTVTDDYGNIIGNTGDKYLLEKGKRYKIKFIRNDWSRYYAKFSIKHVSDLGNVEDLLNKNFELNQGFNVIKYIAGNKNINLFRLSQFNNSDQMDLYICDENYNILFENHSRNGELLGNIKFEKGKTYYFFIDNIDGIKKNVKLENLSDVALDKENINPNVYYILKLDYTNYFNITSNANFIIYDKYSTPKLENNGRTFLAENADYLIKFYGTSEKIVFECSPDSIYVNIYKTYPGEPNVDNAYVFLPPADAVYTLNGNFDIYYVQNNNTIKIKNVSEFGMKKGIKYTILDKLSKI